MHGEKQVLRSDIPRNLAALNFSEKKQSDVVDAKIVFGTARTNFTLSLSTGQYVVRK
jgi:hypothetical protein